MAIAGSILVLTLMVIWFRMSLNTSRRPAREVRALAIGYDLIHTTNFQMLVDVGPGFRADLGRVLAWPAWREIDRSPPQDAWAVVRLIITNDHGQALRVRLHDKFPEQKMRLLAYQRIPESESETNQGQPERSGR